MSDNDNFEDRLRAIADEISRSMQRISEVDLDDVAERYGVDADRARAFADAAGQWLSDRLSGGDPLFGQRAAPSDVPATPSAAEPETNPPRAPRPSRPQDASPAAPGPHPLDLPTPRQGLALAALDSGRWTVRPGSTQLTGSGEGPPPPAAPDLVSDLRARDWITADGTLTLVGRHALRQWCRSAEEASPPPPAP